MRILGYLLIVFGGLYLVLLCFLYFYQDRLVFFPSRRLHVSHEQVGLVFEEVGLVADGTPIHGWYCPSDSEEAPVVLFCHGNAGNIADRVEFLEHLHASGLAVLIFDYAGYGKSGGRPSEDQAYADAEAAYRWLLERGYKEGQIILYGRSLGGAVAAHVARDRALRAVVLEATFSSAAALAAEHYPWAPVRLLLRYRFDAARHIGRARSSVFVIASPQDEIVPFGLSMQLFEAAPEPRHFIRSEGGHNSLAPVDWRAILNTSGLAAESPSG